MSIEFLLVVGAVWVVCVLILYFTNPQRKESSFRPGERGDES